MLQPGTGPSFNYICKLFRCEPPSSPWDQRASTNYCPDCARYKNALKFPTQCKQCVADGYLKKVYDHCPRCHRSTQFYEKFPVQCGQCSPVENYCLPDCKKTRHWIQFTERCKKCAALGEVVSVKCKYIRFKNYLVFNKS